MSPCCHTICLEVLVLILLADSPLAHIFRFEVVGSLFECCLPDYFRFSISLVSPDPDCSALCRLNFARTCCLALVAPYPATVGVEGGKDLGHAHRGRARKLLADCLPAKPLSRRRERVWSTWFAAGPAKVCAMWSSTSEASKVKECWTLSAPSAITSHPSRANQ